MGIFRRREPADIWFNARPGNRDYERVMTGLRYGLGDRWGDLLYTLDIPDEIPLESARMIVEGEHEHIRCLVFVTSKRFFLGVGGWRQAELLQGEGTVVQLTDMFGVVHPSDRADERGVVGILWGNQTDPNAMVLSRPPEVPLAEAETFIAALTGMQQEARGMAQWRGARDQYQARIKALGIS